MLSLSGLRAEAVVPHVRELLLRDYRLRPNFAEQLREIGSPSARAALRDGLKSANPRVRDECAKQLWILKDAAAKDVLAASLRGGDAETQAQLTAFLQPFARSQTNSPAYSPDATPQMWADWLEKQ
jgi:HEAT repeat protein